MEHAPGQTQDEAVDVQIVGNGCASSSRRRLDTRLWDSAVEVRHVGVKKVLENIKLNNSDESSGGVTKSFLPPT